MQRTDDAFTGEDSISQRAATMGTATLYRQEFLPQVEDGDGAVSDDDLTPLA